MTRERVFAAIHAIYSGGHTAKLGRANCTIDIFHTDEESMPFTAWFFNTCSKQTTLNNLRQHIRRSGLDITG